ncbi:Septin-domain-containing protein [Piptocephalis cylindrospora]|uniref:Septin-domain-containing protein n=1 Tax=Piptocephalis cylindrospora TaxID=1907219 RepID=A0A4P9Y818_9FUNG|nr:Septin-domain-containing protein [Piptocephalis cylindrospora]|eukprot:RKP15155.1 Septin-domain-containing protein [Piptocephalis cylindrospora]
MSALTLTKNLKKGIQFTIMTVGPSGLGRTTFINTLCGKQVAETQPAEFHEEGQVRLRPSQVELEEDGLKIALTVVDTPGFGDSIDNSSAFKEVLGYVEKHYDDVLAEESRIKRNPKFKDNRVHALLYFITPTGHSLRQLDVEFMRQLSPRVNVIPVIGKADSFTRQELLEFKKRVMEDIEYYNIPIYNFPYDIEEDDDETVEENTELRGLLPFAIIGGDDQLNGIRVRQYPWGVVEVDNTDHCDLAKLRYALLSSHLNDLKEITHDFLYENYRTEKLSGGAEEEEDEDDYSQDEDDEAGKIRIREEALQAEEDKLREKEARVQREISEKRQDLLAKESALRTLESRLTP